MHDAFKIKQMLYNIDMHCVSVAWCQDVYIITGLLLAIIQTAVLHPFYPKKITSLIYFYEQIF